MLIKEQTSELLNYWTKPYNNVIYIYICIYELIKDLQPRKTKLNQMIIKKKSIGFYKQDKKISPSLDQC